MIQLLPLDDAAFEQLLRDPAVCLRGLGTNADEVMDFLLPALKQAQEFHARISCQPPWHGYLGHESSSQRLVGICGFKGNPNSTGEVEIAYGTAPPLEGRGFATGMAKGLVTLAFRSPAVTRVIAHTLPEPNASTRVLKKTGLVFVGEVMDPEDGRVWRWQIDKPPVH